MKALRKMHAARGLSLETATTPAFGPSDVLVRVRAASICGTDLHIYGWDRWSQGRIKPPVTLGHEFCGVVDSVGGEVGAVKSGDFVSAEMHVNCGHCHQCRVGEAHICQNLRIIGIDQDGAFAEFVKIPAANIIKLDPAIPERYGAILDPLEMRCTPFWPGRLRGGRHWLRVRADRIDVHRSGQGLWSFYRVCHRNQPAAAGNGQENGRGRSIESCGGGCSC